MTPSRSNREQPRRTAVTRRRLLHVTALGGAGMAAAAVIGCGNEQKPTPTTGTTEVQQPKRGGILRRMSSPEVQLDLDPHTGIAPKPRVYHLMYQGLLGYNPETYDVEPDLAQKWEQPDNLTIILTLQQAVKWHNRPPANGRLMTMQDVVFSLERVRTNEPQFLSRALLQGVKIEPVDNSTLKLTAPKPDAGFLDRLSADQLVVMAPEVVERSGRFADVELVIGTGPFIMKSRTEQVGAEFVRNPDYWKPGLPYLDGIRTSHFAVTPPDDRAYAAFLGGQLDVIVVPGQEVQRYLSRQVPEFKPLWYKADTMTMAIPNVDVKPFDDARVTKALRLLIDHEEMATAWMDLKIGKGSNGGFLPPALDSWDLKPEEWKGILEWKQPKTECSERGARAPRCGWLQPVESPQV